MAKKYRGLCRCSVVCSNWEDFFIVVLQSTVYPLTASLEKCSLHLLFHLLLLVKECYKSWWLQVLLSKFCVLICPDFNWFHTNTFQSKYFSSEKITPINVMSGGGVGRGCVTSGGIFQWVNSRFQKDALKPQLWNWQVTDLMFCFLHLTAYHSQTHNSLTDKTETSTKKTETVTLLDVSITGFNSVLKYLDFLSGKKRRTLCAQCIWSVTNFRRKYRPALWDNLLVTQLCHFAQPSRKIAGMLYISTHPRVWTCFLLFSNSWWCFGAESYWCGR